MAGPKSFLNFPQDKPQDKSSRALASPPACPKCGSRHATSSAKRPSPDSYWRCINCGEVWNPALLMTPRRGGWQR